MKEHNWPEVVLQDIVQIEDERTVNGEVPYHDLSPLRNFRGNYGVPKLQGNTVVKGFFEADPGMLMKLDDLHSRYLEELRKSLPVVETKSLIQGRYYHLEQPFIEGCTFESFLATTNSIDEIVGTYQHLLDLALNFIFSSKEIVGIDQKPENWIRGKDKGWIFLDTFPPFYTSTDLPFKDVFYLRDFEKDFADNPDRSFFRQLKKVARRFWIKSNKIVDIDLCDATLEVLQEYDKTATEYWQRYRGNYK